MTSGREKWERYIEHYADTAGPGTYFYTKEQVDFLFEAREKRVSWENIAKIWNEHTGWEHKTKGALEQKYFMVKNFG